MPELAGSGALCHPPSQRPDRGTRAGATETTVGFLVPLLLPPGGRGGAVRGDP